jgi:curved DNA-binding protein CbpA
MTYYEELGVRQDAPVEDIRQAYKLLARLLHPDNQVEPALQPMAQRQMQRLVEIIAVLSDPGKRSQYDEMLAVGNRLPAPCRRHAISASVPPGWRESHNRAAEFALRHWFWSLNGLFVMVFGTWALVQGNPGAADHSGVHSAGWQGTYLAHQAFQKKSFYRTNQAQRQQSSMVVNSSPVPAAEESPIAALPPILTSPKPLLSAPGAETLSATLFTSPELPAAAAKPETTPPLPEVSLFTGTWLYSPRSGDVSERGMYSAIYVELLLAEHAGALTGDYRARYNVPDRAVSPEVTFTIRGGEGSDISGKVSWRSNDNAKGQAEMTLRAPDVLDFNWWTTEFGRQATLGSGTATLIRLRVP